MVSNNDSKRLIESGEAKATTLLVLASAAFDDEFLYWHPDTLLMEMERHYDCSMPQISVDRLQAAISLVTDNNFQASLADFVTICNVLSGDSPDPEQWDPADLDEIVWGVVEASIIEPSDDDEFDTEIRAYIGKLLDDNGILVTPPILAMAIRDNEADPTTGAFSDDPVIFPEIYQRQTNMQDALVIHVQNGLRELADQLSQLGLESLNDVIEKLRRA